MARSALAARPPILASVVLLGLGIALAPHPTHPPPEVELTPRIHPPVVVQDGCIDPDFVMMAQPIDGRFIVPPTPVDPNMPIYGRTCTPSTTNLTHLLSGFLRLFAGLPT